MHSKLACLLLILLPCIALKGQELDVTVTVNDQRIQSTEKNIYRDMEQNFALFMNERKWTNNEFANHEKIKCSIFITIETAPSITSYTANVQIQAARPVFGTNYETLLLNFADRDWSFEYTESKPLNFNEQSYSDNLTSMLAFYAYIIIGLDYDSFEKTGGDPYFARARNVVVNAQQSNRPGWTQFDSNRNRYWLSENLSKTQFLEMREGYYTYHRLAMDAFLEDPDESRKVILEALKSVKKANDITPNAIFILSFMDTKSSEIIKIFSDGDPAIRKQVYDLLLAIEPSKASNYDPIINN